MIQRTKHVQNTTPREYETVNGFEIRFGKFVNPNEHLDGLKFEIRILNPDLELMIALKDKIKEIVTS